jgi:hypothetical protein
MKKTIYISGLVATNLLMIGAAFKALHFPGANIIFCLAIFAFSYIFLPFGLASSYESQEHKRYKWLTIVTFIIFFVLMNSALFTVMHWQGSAILTMISIPLPFILFLPVYLYSIRKDKDHSPNNLLGIMFGLTFIAVFSAFFSLTVSRSFIDNITNDTRWLENNRAYSTSLLPDSINNEVNQKSDEICQFIDKLKCDMLVQAGNNCNNEKLFENYSNQGYKGADNTHMPFSVLFNSDDSKNIYALADKLSDLKNCILNEPGAPEELKTLAGKLLPDKMENTSAEKIEWAHKQFPTTHLACAINALTQIQANVKFLEAELLSQTK